MLKSLSSQVNNRDPKWQMAPSFFQKVKVESQLLQGHWQQHISKQDGLQFAQAAAFLFVIESC